MATVTFYGEEWVLPVYARSADDRPTECRSCLARILWITTTRGSRMPIEADGISHFARCPDAKRWRVRK